MIPPDQHIIVINQDLARHPAFAHLPNPISIEHVPHNCPRCNDDCWIGPKQKLMAALGTTPVICARCAITTGLLDDNSTFRAANPGIDNAPRRPH